MPEYVYLRKSRDRREKEDPDVLQRHRTILLELARMDGRVLRAEFVYEEIKSGESIGARPEFQRLLAAIRALPDCRGGQVQGTLYCMDADRLSRGMLREQGEIQELLIAKGILLRMPSGTMELRDRSQRLMHTIKGAVAEHEIAQYKERVAHTRALQVRQGQVRNGSVPYGYEWDFEAKQPRPHPDEFPILQALCRDALTMSVTRLSRQYGLPRTTIDRALRSPMIAGWPAQTTAYRPGTKRVRYLPREEWVMPEQPGSYPAAISWEDWLRLQEVRTTRRKGRGGHTAAADGWCRDVVQFVAMPGPVRLSARNTVRDCATYERVVDGQKLYVPRQRVHEAVQAALGRLFARWSSELLEEALAARKAPPAPCDVQALEGRREKARRHLASVVAELTDPDLGEESKGALRELRGKLEQELAGITRQITGARAAVPRLSATEAEQAGGLAQRLAGYDDRYWERITEQERRLTVRLFVRVVEVTVERLPGSHRYRWDVTVRLYGQ